ncbi:hypothetical protein NDU88_006173 [Pleurodeles waltl]|uniref:Uncharacterized protein n=1 Tax=Pleurodeles waltl TaxID=8319 RepID=A0AAV7VQ15_PLEWA|nr:hypothetical protein NDU88_006173 [Pleurodeles waltl]
MEGLPLERIQMQKKKQDEDMFRWHGPFASKGNHDLALEVGISVAGGGLALAMCRSSVAGLEYVKTSKDTKMEEGNRDGTAADSRKPGKPEQHPGIIGTPPTDATLQKRVMATGKSHLGVY